MALEIAEGHLSRHFVSWLRYPCSPRYLSKGGDIKQTLLRLFVAVCTLWLFHLVTWLEIDITKQLRVQILQFCTALGTDWQTSRVCFSQNRFSVVLAFLPSLALLCDYGSRPFFFTVRAAYLNTQKQRDCFAVYIGQVAEEIREKEVKNSILPTHFWRLSQEL